MRLIDAKALYERIKEHHDLYVNAWGGFKNLPANDKARVDAYTCCIAEVMNSPTIDAVPVVRCKDCVCVSGLNDDLICSRIGDVMDGYYHGTVDIVKPDDYCSYGKRRVAKCKGAVENG